MFLPVFGLCLWSVSGQKNEVLDVEVIELSPFEVISVGDRGYAVSNSIGASRVNVPVEDISSSITTLNREFLDDIGAIGVVDAIKYVAGVDMAAPLAPQWSIRGTGVNVSMLDGIPDPSASRERFDPWLTERIEVIKGPAGTLYGSHSAGGLVNRVSKFALPESHTDVRLSVGSWDQKGIAVDINRAPSDELQYRVLGLVRDGEYFYDGSVYKSELISPMISYYPKNGGKIWSRFTYRSEQRPTEGLQNYFLDAENHISFILPRDILLDNTDVRFRTWFRGYEAGYTNQMRTENVDWAFRLVGRYSDSYSDSIQYIKPEYRFIDASGGVIGTADDTTFDDPRLVDIEFDRGRRERGTDQESYLLNGDLSAEFDIGSVRHLALLYMQFGENDRSDFENIADYAPSSINNPVYFANGRDGVYQKRS